MLDTFDAIMNFPFDAILIKYSYELMTLNFNFLNYTRLEKKYIHNKHLLHLCNCIYVIVTMNFPSITIHTL